ncbi:hypothetical protein BX616_006225 [Lobosporangium transversale]|nr:hypothetical protein BX616_006225 [Lobosporangium transversale]
MADLQFQEFRMVDIIEKVCVRTTSISASNNSSSPYYVDLQDVQDVFPDVLWFKLDGFPVPFLVDYNGNRIEPLRIAFYPNKVLDIITEAQFKELLKEGKESDQEIPKLQWELIRLQVKIKERDDEMLKLQLKANVQSPGLANLQKSAKAILSQDFELHDCPIPQLFIILPADRIKWDQKDVLKNKIRLHFLCEGEERAEKASGSGQNQIHIAKHEGYEVQNVTEFFRKYGMYIFILLQRLKLGTSSLTPVNATIDHSIDYMEALSKKYPALDDINTIDDYEGLRGADLQQLSTFLRIHEEDKRNGDLYRITTETNGGKHYKWVCCDHFHPTYDKKIQKAFEKAVEMNGGKYDSQAGKATITLKSKKRAKEFFGALAKASRIYELDITFSWDWAKTDLEAFESALKKSNVSILRLELGQFQESSSRKLLPTSTLYAILTRTIEHSNMKAIHIVLFPDLNKPSNLQLKGLPYLHKLTIEMNSREIGPSELQALAKSLKINTALTTLDLRDSPIRGEGAHELLEALKDNETLTTMSLTGNLIGDEGAVTLSESLENNMTLISLQLDGNSIGDNGALALSKALKVNTKLTTLKLGNNLIRDEGAQEMSEMLKSNNTLSALHLDGNSIGDEGALALSVALKANVTLTTLGLEGNSIGDEGVLALSEALKVNTTLTTLCLDGNLFEDEGALKLLEVVKTKTKFNLIT